MTALAAGRLPRIALPKRARRWLFLLALLATVIASLYLTWFRDSGLVRVQDVTVTGLSGPAAPRLRAALRDAGVQQTTLHIKVDELRKAVAGSPEIRALTATPDFPHGLRVDVTENHPVAVLVAPGRGRLPVAANGTLMPGTKSDQSVPEVNLGAMPGTARPGGQARVDNPATTRLVRVAAAAPPALLRRATTIGVRKGEGVVVVLRSGPRIIFGDTTSLDAKWAAAAAVLASPDSSGASYVDVRLPERPVAGGLPVQEPPPGAVQAPAQTTQASPQGTAPAASTQASATTTPAAPTAPVTPQSSGTAGSQADPQAPPTNPQP